MLEQIWGSLSPYSWLFPSLSLTGRGASLEQGGKVTWAAWKSFPSSKINFLTRHFLPIPLHALCKDFNPCGEVRPKS